MNRKITLILRVVLGIAIMTIVALFGGMALAVLRAQAWKINPQLAAETARFTVRIR